MKNNIRCLQFPQLFSIETLSTRAAKTNDPWQIIGEARGEVNISKTHEVALSVKRHHQFSYRLSSIIKTLKPNDIDALDLGRTGISDKEIPYVIYFPLLKELDLGWTKVTDKGISHLKTLTELTKLKLSFVSVDDSVLLSIKQISSLVDLSIKGTLVTDNGIAYIGSMQKLERLNITHTRISNRGYENLRKTIPSCEIVK